MEAQLDVHYEHAHELPHYEGALPYYEGELPLHARVQGSIN